MIVGILGRKVGMTQVYQEDGTAVPVTVIEAGPCHVLQIRTPERDGYEAIQLGYLDKPRRLATRAERGHVARRMESKRSKRRLALGIEPPPKPGCEPKRFIRELRGPTEGYEVGQEVRVDIFQDVEAVDVIGTSKGRGYSGVMRRHGFAGQRASHGVKKVHRHMGGTGCSAFPSRVIKGKRMPGQYGNARCTVRNLKVVAIDPEKNLLLVKGAVPGPNGGFLVIRKTNKVG